MIKARTIWPLMAVVGIALLVQGCHRGFYRRQADAESRRLVGEKTNDQRWDSATGSIEVDPQSRMFNPFSQDHPPMPKDDPASHQFMHKVDCKPGYPQWHANGDTNYAENPEWLAYLPVNEKGEVVINLERAVDLAFLHSSVYQQQKETLYLSALDVSLERFDFDGQLNFGRNAFFNTQGRLASGGSVSQFSSALGNNSQGINWQKLGITGTNFAVGLANSVLWNFAGPSTQSANSLINFSIIQPLLRNAGRARIMESLTQSERTLLANVRQIDRYRRGFYMQVAVGRSPGQGPGGSFLGLPQGASGPGGLIGLLQQSQQIRNQEFAVRQFESVLNQFRELFDRDRIDSLQKVQVESQLYSSQQQLLQLRRNYQDALDRFKQTLGIPPHVNVVIEDTFLDRFELISNQINERQVVLNRLREITGTALIRLGDVLPSELPLTPVEIADLEDNKRKLYLETIEKEGKQDFANDPNLVEFVEALLPFVRKGLETVAKVKNDENSQIEADFEKLESVKSDRVAYLKKLQEIVDSGQLGEMGEIEAALLAPESIAETQDSVDREGKPSAGMRTQLTKTMEKVELVEQSLLQIEQLIGGFAEMKPALNDQRLYEFLRDRLLRNIPKQLTDLYNNIVELSLIQAQARSNSISLADIDLDPKVALEIARCLRLDWMNARASLVDAWREIEFTADQLESQFDLVLEGSAGNFVDNPFKIRFETGTLRGGFRFDSPIVRQAERNQYRETLIQYQQARRNYYRFEDEVNRNLRASIRGINLNKILFELNRRSVAVQIEQVEQARLRLEEPGRIQTGTNARSTLGSTVAQDLLRAIQGLQSSQNAYLNVWVNYEVGRRNLDFDLGTMQLDEMGRWIDPGEIDNTIGHRAAAMMGLDPTCLDCGLNCVMSQMGFDLGVIETYDHQMQEIPGEGIAQPGFELRAPDQSPQPTPSSHDFKDPIRKTIPGENEIDVAPIPDAPTPVEMLPEINNPNGAGVEPNRLHPFSAAVEKLRIEVTGDTRKTVPEFSTSQPVYVRKKVEGTEILRPRLQQPKVAVPLTNSQPLRSKKLIISEQLELPQAELIQISFSADVGKSPFALDASKIKPAYFSVLKHE